MITKPKGTYDLIGKEARIYNHISNVLNAYARLYNYQLIRTPIFESDVLYKRGVGESSDIVQKETYDFEDRSGRNMTLRPEGTAGVVRSYIENKLYGENPINKFYYLGTMYRYERPGLGRYRELTQFGVEVLGSDDPLIDAEIISFNVNVLKELGIDTTVKINNLGSPEDRKRYKEALLEYLTPHLNELCEDCQNRIKLNPLRILDCKIDGESDLLKNAPSILDYQSPESTERFNKILEYLDYLDVNYEIDKNLVRGLDYYDYMVYELKAESDGLSISGGGRYNHLVSELDGPETPCVGFAAGVERVMSLLIDKYPDNDDIDVYVMAVNSEEKLKANSLLQDLRLNDIICDTDYLNKGLKGQFKDADRYHAKQLVILNSEDLQKGLINVKDNVTKEEHKIPEDEIIDYLLGVI